LTAVISTRKRADVDDEGGIELDADEARRWRLAVEQGGSGLASDRDSGVFGDRVALLDFEPGDLERLRRLAPHVRLVAHDATDSALAISGSSAQGRVQLVPGDADFFERVHIRARDASAAAAVLREVMRATALRALDEPDIVLVEANLGVYPEAVIERGVEKAAGDPITWTPADVLAGAITVQTPDRREVVVDWDSVDVSQGWVYLGWIVADRELGRIALASNMIDATWEDESGAVRSLDSAVDPVAQEVYLEESALALVERLNHEVPPGAREAYREIMRSESRHYTHEDPSYAKAAKRLYNLFRVADELEAATYVRELFDEPQARLYQVPGLLEAADYALDPDSGIDRDTVLRQLAVIAEAIELATEGEEEAELLRELKELEALARSDGKSSEQWAAELADVRDRSSAFVNEFFRTRLLAHDRVREIVESLASE
jgi:hypothetical protein